MVQLFPPSNACVLHISPGKRGVLPGDVLPAVSQTPALLSFPSISGLHGDLKLCWQSPRATGLHQGDFKLRELAKYLIELKEKGSKGLRITKNRFGYVNQKIGKLFPWLLPCYLQKVPPPAGEQQGQLCPV